MNMKYLKYWCVLWMGIIIQGFQTDGIFILYSIPFMAILALPFIIDVLEPWAEEQASTAVYELQQQYVRGELDLLRFEEELEKELEIDDY